MAELTPGTKAPAWELPALGEGMLSQPDGLVWLTIFKSSCPTCRWALPYTQRLFERVEASAPGTLQVLGIAEDSAQDAKAFADELGLTFPIAVESDPWEISQAFGLTTVPTSFLIENGEIVLTSPGFGRDDLAQAAERALGKGQPLFVEEEKIPAFRPG